MEIKVMKKIMDANDTLAQDNRALFCSRKIKTINVMASPGAGKTSVIVKLIELLRGSVNFSVIEGDIASSIDAVTIDSMGIPVVQINTGGECHLDAGMIRTVVNEQNNFSNSLLFIENVGNLICPSSFDLGENLRMLIASVPEGHDKPYKYTSMFAYADIIVLNKVDLMPYIEFDKQAFYKGIDAINQKAQVFEVSCRTGEGFDKLTEYFREFAASK
jgi:hydrogenase nickel incorporation protein HypB